MRTEILMMIMRMAMAMMLWGVACTTTWCGLSPWALYIDFNNANNNNNYNNLSKTCLFWFFIFGLLLFRVAAISNEFMPVQWHRNSKEKQNKINRKLLNSNISYIWKLMLHCQFGKHLKNKTFQPTILQHMASQVNGERAAKRKWNERMCHKQWYELCPKGEPNAISMPSILNAAG